ncbi:hypothetical protein F5884DRAFT_189573 [Xylogone sp. PMI_703]|nr:hypothetical protein F5884DRAFT_189573 [Xylogone sp. PMI_703]
MHLGLVPRVSGRLMVEVGALPRLRLLETSLVCIIVGCLSIIPHSFIHPSIHPSIIVILLKSISIQSVKQPSLLRLHLFLHPSLSLVNPRGKMATLLAPPVQPSGPRVPTPCPALGKHWHVKHFFSSSQALSPPPGPAFPLRGTGARTSSCRTAKSRPPRLQRSTQAWLAGLGRL